MPCCTEAFIARKSKFSEAEIIGAIKEIEGGATSTETARKMGVSINTMQRWRSKYGGMTVGEAQDKKRLEDEGQDGPNGFHVEKVYVTPEYAIRVVLVPT